MPALKNLTLWEPGSEINLGLGLIPLALAFCSLSDPCSLVPLFPAFTL